MAEGKALRRRMATLLGQSSRIVVEKALTLVGRSPQRGEPRHNITPRCVRKGHVVFCNIHNSYYGNQMSCLSCGGVAKRNGFQ